MTVVLRFVDSNWNVKERFIRVVYVMETSALTLKFAIDNLLAELSLSVMKIRGQVYDRASNMKGKFSGLKALIMNENQCAYYVHCFSQQLQLALVAVARKHVDIADFFNMISTLMNVVGASCKRKDMLRHIQAEKVAEGIKSVHEVVSCDASDSLKKAQARGLLRYLQSYDFVFNLQLMMLILGFIYDLSLALQRKDEDILNAMSLVKVTKMRLQTPRDDGWEALLGKITAFCNEHEITCLNMDDAYVDPCHPRRKKNITNEFHYRVEGFYVIMDKQILEINDWFNEVNSELLLCVASLNPNNSFGDFDKAALIKMTQFYPLDFSEFECMNLENQLETYILDVRIDDRFCQLKGLGDLSALLVLTKKYLSCALVYRLLKLALILPVATAGVERCFSAMNIVKTDLRNQVVINF